MTNINKLKALKKMHELGIDIQQICFGTPEILQQRVYTFSDISKNFEAVFNEDTCYYQLPNKQAIETYTQRSSTFYLDFDTLLELSNIGILKKEVTLTTINFLEI